MNETISGWSSYKMYSEATMSLRLEPGSIIDMWKHVDGPRQVFHYEEPASVYEGYIHTPVENLLTWQPMAVTITFIALVASIAVWIIR